MHGKNARRFVVPNVHIRKVSMEPLETDIREEMLIGWIRSQGHKAPSDNCRTNSPTNKQDHATESWSVHCGVVRPMYQAATNGVRWLCWYSHANCLGVL